jgi:heat shock protein HslJ
LVEHRIRNAGVTGSSPVSGTIFLDRFDKAFAQLPQYSVVLEGLTLMIAIRMFIQSSTAHCIAAVCVMHMATKSVKTKNYTITFGKGGQLSAQLDCNRGVGTWKNETSNATGGGLAIGPLGVTKMLCPPPSIGEMLEKNLGSVRSFIIKDGKMHMSLMADGGIIAWKPLRTK